MPCPCLLIDCNDSKNEIFNCIVKITQKNVFVVVIWAISHFYTPMMMSKKVTCVSPE